jgi:hypothetical protein
MSPCYKYLVSKTSNAVIAKMLMKEMSQLQMLVVINMPEESFHFMQKLPYI